jgi:hypothetical protein
MPPTDRKKHRSKPIVSNETRKTDKLAASYALVIAVMIVSVVSLGLVFIHAAIRSHSADERTLSVIRALDLSNLALTPSGRAQRASEILNPAVDLRFVPTLPRMEPDTAAMLIETPDVTDGSTQ